MQAMRRTASKRKRITSLVHDGTTANGTVTQIQIPVNRVPSTLSEFTLNFIVQNVEERAAVYEYFNFSGNLSFSMDVDPIEAIDKGCTIFVCPCENPAGPLIPKTLANDLCL
jgi:hypothetical protein